ncbi:phosphotransferase [Arthrobacter sp. Hz1]
MLPVTLVDYTQTARRLPWTALPTAVCQHFASVLDASVESAAAAGGGFTNGFAAVLSGAGRTLFAKAAPSTDSHIFAAYVREAEVLTNLPTGLPIPLLRSADRLTVEGIDWQLLSFKAVNGYMPGRPWTAADLGAVHHSLLVVQSALRHLPAGLSGGSMVDEFFGDRPATDVFGQFARNGGAPPYLPRLTTAQLGDLQEVASHGREALTGDSVLHNDLRADNIIISAAGRKPARALFCDWNFLSTGPAWADWVALLVYPHHAGIDVDRWLAESPLSAGAAPDHIDAWLATLAAYMITSAAQPELATSPLLRTHQRFTARILIDWLSERRKWDL